MRIIFFYSKLFQCVLVQGLRFEHTKNIDIFDPVVPNWSQRHQSYFHLVSYFNHFHLQEGVTFCINELHVSFAEMMYRKKSWDVNCFSDYQDGLQTDESRHQVKGKVHMCWYIRGRKNTVEVCSCGEHSIWKHKLLLCNRVFLLYLFD